MPPGLGPLIRRRREDLRLTQAQLASKVGVSRSAVNEWEHGRTKQLRGRNIYRLAKVLEVDPLELLDVRLELRAQADPEQDVVRALEADPELKDYSREIVLAAYRQARGIDQRTRLRPPRVGRQQRAARP